MDKTMKLTKADAYRYADDLVECTRRLYDFLDGEAELWIEYSCFKDIEKKAMMIFDWIVNTDDEETASTLAKLDRNLWHRILKFCDIFCHKGIKLYNSMTTVYDELLRVQNWYLKTVYKLPYEAIENNKYYIHPETGEVRNSKTQEVLQAHKDITLPDELCTDKAKNAFAKAIEKGLMEHDGNGYKWIATNSLYGYFVDKLSDKIELKTSNNRIQWNIFKGIVTNHGSIVDTARQAVNDYKNKGLNPPEGDYIVDEILKDL